MTRRRVLGSLAIVLLFFATTYAALVVATHVDAILLPANQLSLDRVGIPGTHAQVNLSLPGVDSDTDGDRRINVLVLGIDWRPELGERSEDPGRSDSMYVITVDLDGQTGRVLGIPRDLWVEVPARGGESWIPARINEAYLHGEATETGQGPEYAARAVERNFDIPIDHWVVIDWEGFKTLIDALGGVDVRVEEELYDPRYPDILAAFPGGVVEPGLHHMNGEQALGYSRVRFTERGDLDRIRRQQQLMVAVVNKAVSVDALRNALPLWREYRDAIMTDVKTVQVAGLALLARNVVRRNLEMYSLGDAVSDWTTPSGGQVLVPVPEEQERIIRRFLGEPPATPTATATETETPAPGQVASQ